MGWDDDGIWSAVSERLREAIAVMPEYQRLCGCDVGETIYLWVPEGAFAAALPVIERRSSSTGESGPVVSPNGTERWWLLPGEVRVLGGRDA